jgi:hypothetical protein
MQRLEPAKSAYGVLRSAGLQIRGVAGAHTAPDEIRGQQERKRRPDEIRGTPLPTRGCVAATYFLRARCAGQGTVAVVLVEDPSSKVNEAENGKPPRGQCSGTPIPVGRKCTSLPWTCLV